MKSSPDEIRARFDADVERFANLETGQSAAVDAPLVLELITQAAAAVTPHARAALDVGCGAGNYTLKLLQRLPGLDVTLLDLSQPMLDRARQRVSAVATGRVRTVQADIRAFEPGPSQYDVIVAAAVFHHLRGEDEWRAVFRKLYLSLRPGGSLWISDLIEHSTPAVQALMWARYGAYLTALKGDAHRDTVFAYIEKEDSPRPLLFQLDQLRAAGFQQVEVLHKNSVFAAFGGLKTA